MSSAFTGAYDKKSVYNVIVSLLVCKNMFDY